MRDWNRRRPRGIRASSSGLLGAYEGLKHVSLLQLYSQIISLLGAYEGLKPELFETVAVFESSVY